ncbi:MAG: galactosamine-6-phosphate isomerase [Verrucomicrobiae bacterium]|nr:galactosamine-6-phosphate isomerase [Verrucomicrobiae bacterium]
MNPLHIIVETDYEAMSRRAADCIVEQIRSKPDLLMCVATGSSPRRAYERLAEKRQEQPQLFDRLRVLKLDEWGGLPPEHPGACETYVRRLLIEPLGVSAARYLTFRGDAAEMTAECERVREMMRQHGPIDLAVLGLGLNGHLGMNEPADELIAGPHVAPLSAETARHAMIRDANPPVRFGLTLGMGDLMQSRRIVLLVNGAAKREALRRLMSGRVTTQFPASLLWLHGGVTCFCDREAAAGLDIP